MSFDKFKNLMMRTMLPDDETALRAIRLANAILAGTNQTWEDLLKGKVKMEGVPSYVETTPTRDTRARYDDATEINALFEELDRKIKVGNTFRDFIDSVHEWWDVKGFLTPKQYEALTKALDK